MEQKYFLHRIQQEDGTVTKGIEVHDTLEAAILSFWGRMKLAYNARSNIDYVSCKITDTNGAVISPYDMTWANNANVLAGKFFMHYIRLDGENWTKNIDICDSFDAARVAYAAQMEYGYNNPGHSTVAFVSCEICDRYGVVMAPFRGMWKVAEPEPEPEA